MKIIDVAIICHQANKALCESMGDNSQCNWDEAETHQQESAVKGVQFKLDNPDATPEQQHESWAKAKHEDGWKYGEIKDAELKTHPCLIPYELLPLEQQAKDHLFAGIVNSLAFIIE